MLLQIRLFCGLLIQDYPEASIDEPRIAMTSPDRLQAMITVKMKRIHPDAQLPKYANPGDSGADLYAVEEGVLQPLERRAIATGLCAEIQTGYEIQIRPKSGLALNSGLTVLNTPGTVDASYRGEIKVILINLSDQPYAVKKGQKIAQMVIAPVMIADFMEVDDLSQTQRDTGGFGSTGIR